jgi:predicted Zn-dependent protease
MLRRLDEPELADQMLQRAEDLPIEPAQRQIFTARHFTLSGHFDRSDHLLRDLLKEQPTQLVAWLDLIRNALRQRQLDQAVRRLDQALAHHPEEPPLLSLSEQRERLEALTGALGVHQLALALLGPGQRHEPAARALELMRAAQAGQDPQTVSVAAQQLAEKHPREFWLWVSLIDAQRRWGQTPAAIAMGQRLRSRFPGEPLPAEQLARLTFQAQLWEQAAREAQAWAERTIGAPFQAHLIRARALLRLNRPLDAVKLLEPYKRAQGPDAPPTEAWIGPYSRGLLRSGQTQRAEHRVWAFIEQNPQSSGPELWMTLAVEEHPSLEGGQDWLRRLEQASLPEVPAELADRRSILLAKSWVQLGRRWDKPELVGRGMNRLEAMAQRQEVPEAQLVLGTLLAQRQQWAQAAKRFRTYLQTHPQSTSAKNNLAMSLLHMGPQNAAEAQLLIEQIIREDPSNPYYRDTRALTYSKQRRWKEAAEAWEEVLPLWVEGSALRIEARMHLVEALHRSGQEDQAMLVMGRRLPPLEGLPERLQRRIQEVRAMLERDGQEDRSEEEPEGENQEMPEPQAGPKADRAAALSGQFVAA